VAGDPGRPSRVEVNGINVIADEERKGRPRDLFWPWFAANISVFGISYGAFVLGFGISFWQATVAGLVGGAAFAAWKWWSKQSNPDWLVEPTEPTEATDSSGQPGSEGSLTVLDPHDSGSASLNGSAPQVDRVDGSPDATGLDPEVEAKQAENDGPNEAQGEPGRGDTYP